MSSRKFSYWSSPQITTKSGLNASSSSRMRRKPATRRARCSSEDAYPSSSPYSIRIGSGQLLGFFISSGICLFPRSVLFKGIALSSSGDIRGG